MDQNPILPGYFPDPSVCRVGDSYYLVNSSFQYLPGLPIHCSKDFIHWQQIGNVYSRRGQIDLRESPSNGGFYAPTIRHRDGRFYVVSTDLGTVAEGQMISSAEDPAGEWSIPVRVAGAIGIDPDLFWDEDGTCYLTWKGMSDTGLKGILSVAINPETGERLGEVRELWQGSGLASPEGPHLRRHGGFYYCQLAEGGTESAHCVTIARAKSLEGPWEACPANPILTHRGTTLPVQNTGHADLVELADGSWAAVFLGVRPRGNSPRYHVNGRETFVAGIDWVDDWPVVDEERFAVDPAETSFQDDFSDELGPHWFSHGGHHWDSVSRVDDGLEIRPIEFQHPVPAIAVRARDLTWRAEAEVSTQGTPALQLHMDTDSWAEIRVEGNRAIAAWSVVGIRGILGEFELDGPAEGLIIATESWPEEPVPSPGPDIVVLSVRTSTGEAEVARFDGRVLSTEAAGGFVGRTIGVRAVDGPVLMKRFTYQATSE